MRKLALLSVSDKSGILDFAHRLTELGFEIISTGKTAACLREGGLAVEEVSTLTGFPEILGGRVKSLHPKVHGGILARRGHPEDRKELKKHGIYLIDLVCVNLYPFADVIRNRETTLSEALEQIDIGGPTLLRAAAKNYPDVIPICDPRDYDMIIQSLKNGGPNIEERRILAAKVFAHTSSYDHIITHYLDGKEKFPEVLLLHYRKMSELRYGENPHQQAALYRDPAFMGSSILAAKQLHGKALSFNNIVDASSAVQAVSEFAVPACVALKHTNPCGVGIGASIHEAFLKAHAGDPVSIFGGIVALNREVDAQTAERLASIFLEVVVAPSYSEEALSILKRRKNLRILTLPDLQITPKQEFKSIPGGLLIQEVDTEWKDSDTWEVVTKQVPTEGEWADLQFAWRVVKHVKSNAIVLAKDGATVGIGAGQMNRVGAVVIAARQAQDRAQGSVLASDAFFPMADSVEEAHRAGVGAIIQPGGSIRDADSIAAADELGISMVFTGERHFRH